MDYSEYTAVSLADSRIMYIGRNLNHGDSVEMSWSGSGFELAVKGGDVRARLTAFDAPPELAIWIAVYVNETFLCKIPICSKEYRWYTLASNLPQNSISRIRAIRLTEPNIGTFTLNSIEITGELAEPFSANRRMLCIGDSITCGYGVLSSASKPFRTTDEDVTLTYGWSLAEKFGAQCHIISASGYGVIVGNTGSADDVIPKVYPQAILKSTERWDHECFQPDLILVNLGTNDEFMSADTGALKNGVYAFLSSLRSVHPNAVIVWIYGIMQNGYMEHIKVATEKFAETDSGVHFIPADIATRKSELGSGNHPSYKAHYNLARKLQPEIAELMNWK